MIPAAATDDSATATGLGPIESTLGAPARRHQTDDRTHGCP